MKPRKLYQYTTTYWVGIRCRGENGDKDNNSCWIWKQGWDNLGVFSL